jgi:hypothetical protein
VEATVSANCVVSKNAPQGAKVVLAQKIIL